MSSENISGGDRNFIELAKNWIGKGLNVTIITTKEGENLCKKSYLLSTYIIVESINILKNSIIFTYLYRIFSSLKILSRIASPSNNIVIVSSSDSLPDIILGYFIRLKSKNSRWAVSLNLIHPNPFKGYSNAYTNELKFPSHNEILNYMSQQLSFIFIKSSADLIFIVNSEMYLFLDNKNISRDKVKMVHYGVNMNEYLNIEQNKKIDACFIGRFHPQKGLIDLIDIWNEVCIYKSDATLAIIGTGDKGLENHVKDKIALYKLEDNIKLLGYLDGPEKINILTSSKVFVFPSSYESWGIVACEAMSCGLPVIAYNLPIFEEIFPKGMIKVPIGNIELFAEQICLLLNDRDAYNKNHIDAIEMSKKYRWSDIANDTLSHIESLF